LSPVGFACNRLVHRFFLSQLEIRWINATHRMKYNRHGIKLLFLQSGNSAISSSKSC
jgi:hypothetical protein